MPPDTLTEVAVSAKSSDDGGMCDGSDARGFVPPRERRRGQAARPGRTSAVLEPRQFEFRPLFAEPDRRDASLDAWPLFSDAGLQPLLRHETAVVPLCLGLPKRVRHQAVVLSPRMDTPGRQ